MSGITKQNERTKRNVPSRVTDPEAARFDTTDSGGTDDEDTLRLGLPENLASMALRDTLSDESNGLDLLVLQALQSTRVNGSRAGEVDDDVDVRVLRDGLLQAGVDGEESLLGTPVEFLDVVATEGVDHSSDGGGLTTAGVVEVQHTLDSTGLETVDEGAGVGIERPEPGATVLGDLGLEVDDVVGCLGTLTIGVDGTNSLIGVRDGSDLVTLRRRGSGLDALQSASGSIGGLALREVDAESEGDNLGNVGVGTEDADGDTQALTKETHSLETLLVVGTTTADEDLDFVVDELVLVLLESTNDALEGSSDVGEVGDTTTDDEDLAVGARGATGNEVDYQNR